MKRLPVVFSILFIGVQLCVATIQLTKPRPSRFGWHMFAGIREPLAYAVVRGDGSVDWIRRADYFGNFRGDFDDVVKPVSSLICARRADAIAVRASNLIGLQMDVPCPR